MIQDIFPPAIPDHMIECGRHGISQQVMDDRGRPTGLCAECEKELADPSLFLCPIHGPTEKTPDGACLKCAALGITEIPPELGQSGPPEQVDQPEWNPSMEVGMVRNEPPPEREEK